MPFSGRRPSVVVFCSTIAFPMFVPSMNTSWAIAGNHSTENMNHEGIRERPGVGFGVAETGKDCSGRQEPDGPFPDLAIGSELWFPGRTGRRERLRVLTPGRTLLPDR